MKKKLLTFLPYGILLVLFILAPVAFKATTVLKALVKIMLCVVGAVSLRTISLSGNMSFAHGAFIGLGAYTAAVLAKTVGLSMWLSIPLGAIMALLVGLLTGWPFARLRTIYFCMGSMFMGQAIAQLIKGLKITGSARGMQQIPSMSKALEGVTEAIGWESIHSTYFFFLLVVIISLVCLYRFEHSRIGWTLKALSQSPEVAASIGINERFYRLMSVGVGCFFAGLVGACYAHFNTVLTPDDYAMSMTLWLIMDMMIGGSSSFLGPIVGAIVIEGINALPAVLSALTGRPGASESFVRFSRWLGTNSAYTPFITAAVLLVMAYFVPKGLVGIPGMIRDGIANGKAKKADQSATEGGENDAA